MNTKFLIANWRHVKVCVRQYVPNYVQGSPIWVYYLASLRTWALYLIVYCVIPRSTTNCYTPKLPCNFQNQNQMSRPALERVLFISTGQKRWYHEYIGGIFYESVGPVNANTNIPQNIIDPFFFYSVYDRQVSCLLICSKWLFLTPPPAFVLFFYFRLFTRTNIGKNNSD